MDVNQASLKRNGIQDYISLRATGLILTSYILCIMGFFLTTPDITYHIWKDLFSGLGMKIFTLLALGCVSIHARIGLWQVATDYIHNARVRGVLQFFISVISFVYVAAGLFVLWGV